MADASGSVSLRSALAVGEFRTLWMAEALSQAGDQLARVALSVMVYERTASAGLTGLTYGLTYVPTVVGGVLLSWMADRYPRRAVMIICDLVRALFAGLMAIPGTPLAVLCALLVALTIAGGPFRAAQLAMLPVVLVGEERYRAGLAVRNITIQSAQVAGFAGGGLAIAFVGPYWGLALNAVTFLASGALVRLGVRSRPAADAEVSGSAGRRARSLGVAAREVRAVPGGSTLFWLKMLAGLYVLPEGMAAPFADQLGVGTFAVGLILAADPIGSVIGAWAYTRWVPTGVRRRSVCWLAVGSGVPLVFLAAHPPLPAALALIAASGMLSTPYQMEATALITEAVPNAVRGQVSGLTSTALATVQGVGIMAAGAVAQIVGPASTLGGAAVVGVGLGLVAAVTWSRATATQSEFGRAR